MFKIDTMEHFTPETGVDRPSLWSLAIVLWSLFKLTLYGMFQTNNMRIAIKLSCSNILFKVSTRMFIQSLLKGFAIF